MKKINNIRQLEAKKKQVKEQQAILEHNIKSNWTALKESFAPANIAREEQLNGQHILKTTLNFGATLLARQFVNKAGEKLGKLFKK